jgi:hypothetical protein
MCHTDGDRNVCLSIEKFDSFLLSTGGKTVTVVYPIEYIEHLGSMQYLSTDSKPAFVDKVLIVI